MTDTERLAALIAEWGEVSGREALADYLVSAGVRVNEGCPSCGAPRSGCNDCGWKPEQPIVALAPIKQVELFETSIVKDPPHPSWTIQRIDPDRLTRALHDQYGCRIDCRPLPDPHTPGASFMQDAAAIVKAYEEDAG